VLGELGHQQREQRRQTSGRARLAQPIEQPTADARDLVSTHERILMGSIPAAQA
jgi:hypothetical protein